MKLLSAATTLLLAASTFAAPLSEKDDVAAQGNRAKRSGEVIFFENAQKRGAVQKRSDISMDEWINKFYNNKNEDNDQQETAVQEKVAADIDRSQQKPVVELKDDMISEKVVEEIEEKAFYEALDFLVDRLIAEAYEDEEIARDLGLLETTAAYEKVQELRERTTTPMPKPKPELAKDGVKTDNEADQLASLIGKQQFSDDKPPQVLEPVKEDDLKRDDNSEEREKIDSMEDQGKTAPGYYDDRLIYDGEEDNSDEGYTFDDIIGYFEYLKSIQAMEQKLSMQLGEEEKEERKGETRSDSKDEGAKSRKRRSLDTGDWVRQEDGDFESGGVYFNPSEVTELRDLLLTLAKERLESHEKTDNMAEQLYGNDDEDLRSWFDDASEEEDWTPSPFKEVPEAKLRNLALRMNDQSRDYGSYRPISSKRSSYYNPYLYSGK